MNPTPAALTARTARPLVTAALCGAALVGFAANSLLCRDALGAGTIDAGSFTAIRLRAAIVQLSVPVLTTVAAVAILGETVTPRLAGGTIAIVGGIALALTAKRPAGERSRTPRSD
jgi:drug/metabolite transporter (DMT)-like permease